MPRLSGGQASIAILSDSEGLDARHAGRMPISKLNSLRKQIPETRCLPLIVEKKLSNPR